MWTKEVFGTEKPIIALLHLDALPGEPAFEGSLDDVISHALQDLKAIQDGGADGVLIANENCFPITENTGTVTLMAMAGVVGALKQHLRIPFGTNVVYNPEETIRMAAVFGASFGRSAFGGSFTGTYGIHHANFPEGDARLGSQTTKELVNSLCEGGYAGALCVSGPGAGQEADWDYLAEVSALAKKKNTPVFCNTGCRIDTIEKILSIADGACVGTALKGPDGRVDQEKVKGFMEIAHRVRGEN